MTENLSQESLISVSSTVRDGALTEKAKILATELQLDYCPWPVKQGGQFLLCYTKTGLQLLHKNDNADYRILLYVDFCRGKLGYRLRNSLSIKQSLARAAGIKKGVRPTVLDTTAGLGVDAALMAALGSHVTLYERNPVMFSLLRDGLERAKIHGSLQREMALRMDLRKTDAIAVLKRQAIDHHTVYIDPMFPQRTTSALSKKDIRMVRLLVGDDLDQRELLQAALNSTAKRIVVKRHKLAPAIDSPRKPQYMLAQKTHRYDIYYNHTAPQP